MSIFTNINLRDVYTYRTIYVSYRACMSAWMHHAFMHACCSQPFTRSSDLYIHWFNSSSGEVYFLLLIHPQLWWAPQPLQSRGLGCFILVEVYAFERTLIGFCRNLVLAASTRSTASMPALSDHEEGTVQALSDYGGLVTP